MQVSRDAERALLRLRPATNHHTEGASRLLVKEVPLGGQGGGRVALE